MKPMVYVPVKRIRLKPVKYAFPIYMDREMFEIFTYAYRMFLADEVLLDIWIECNEDDEWYISVWYLSRLRRDADYIRCLRYMLVEAYRTESVFITDEFLHRRRTVNIQSDL